MPGRHGEAVINSILERIRLRGLVAAAFYLLPNHANRVIYEGPLAALGTALIGLGLCRESMDRARPACEAVRR